MEPLLRMEAITKTFPGVVANDQVSFEVAAGEVHALLGENGAGKTTLMNILYGLYRPDAGQIYLRGQPVTFHSPRDAIAHGIGMVHQHFMLIPAFTVAENIVLGLRSSRLPTLDLRQVEERIRRISHAYGLDIDPQAYIWQLPVGVQQRVEIVKALYRESDLLILDEPTAVLTPSEIEDLFRVLRRFVEDGRAVIFITHKLNEALTVADRITVLRQGRTVDTVPREATTPAELARMMVGRPVMMAFEPSPKTPGEVVLEVENLHALNDRGLPALRGISFQVRRGEILGIAGVDGNGQSELAEVINGLRPATEGHVRLLGRDITSTDPQDIIAMNVAYIPPDRRLQGLITQFTVAENLILKNHQRPPISRNGFLNFRAISSLSERLMHEFDIRAPHIHVPVEHLSGGNQQKVVLARELHRTPDLLVAMQPTRGLDVGATEYVIRTMLAQREQDVAILYISTELDELLSISDRIAVMYEGRCMGIVPREEVDLHEIGLMMTGALHKEQAA